MPISYTRKADYEVAIDVTDDGDFTDAADDLSARVRAEAGISISRGKDSARPTSPPMVPSFSFELDNEDRELSAENAASAYYGLLIPDRTARIKAQIGRGVNYNEAGVRYDAAVPYAGRDKTLIQGPIEQPTQHAERSRRSVGITGLGSLARLRGVLITATSVQQNKRTDQLITTILDLAGWPANDRVLSTGDTTVAYWWAIQKDAFEALVEVYAAEGAGAALYEDGQGRIVFENRNYRLTATRSTTVQATFSDTQDGASYNEPGTGYNSPDMNYNGCGRVGFQGFQYDPGLRDVFNTVTMVIDQRYEEAAFTIQWRYGSQLTLGNNEVKVIYAHFSGDPLVGHDSLSPGTHYALISGSLASAVVQQVDVSTRRITLTAGAGGAVVDSAASDSTGFGVGVKRLVSAGEQIVSQTVAGSSQISNTRSLELAADTRAWQVLSQATAEALCDAAAVYYRDPRPVISIEVANATGLALLRSVDREVSDRVYIKESHTGFSGACWVDRVVDRVEAGRLHRVGLICSKVLAGDTPALWDSGEWDNDDWAI